MNDSPTWNDPDFMGHLLLERRIGGHLVNTPGSRAHPRRLMLRKLYCYKVAASHGVQVPKIIDHWQNAELIQWQALPDEFVLKTNTGHSGASVWPLRRRGHLFETVDQQNAFSEKEIQAIVSSYATGRRLPVFAEELLPATSPTVPLPDDVKVYCAYGKVLHIMLRRMPEHANTKVAHYRYVDETGRDLGKVTPARKVSQLVPIPAHLEEIVRVSKLLSLAVPLPFVRVDLYDLPDKVLFGEFTVNPGGMQRFTRDQSSWMATEWEKAESRLQTDMANGRPFSALLGDHDTNHVPED